MAAPVGVVSSTCGSPGRGAASGRCARAATMAAPVGVVSSTCGSPGRGAASGRCARAATMAAPVGVVSSTCGSPGRGAASGRCARAAISSTAGGGTGSRPCAAWTLPAPSGSGPQARRPTPSSRRPTTAPQTSTMASTAPTSCRVPVGSASGAADWRGPSVWPGGARSGEPAPWTAASPSKRKTRAARARSAGGRPERAIRSRMSLSVRDGGSPSRWTVTAVAAKACALRGGRPRCASRGGAAARARRRGRRGRGRRRRSRRAACRRRCRRRGRGRRCAPRAPRWAVLSRPSLRGPVAHGVATSWRGLPRGVTASWRDCLVA